jgi:uncharacterized membrane protein YeaQ/YmgE (transglycosylase-associated protein family)
MTAGFIIAILISGLWTGALARLALPGPDPMPLWLTISIGLAGSVVGAVVGKVSSNGNGYVVSFLSLGVAIALVAAYRHFVQKRPIVGPGAMKFPERGLGVEHQRERLRKAGIDPDALTGALLRPAAPPAPEPEPATAPVTEESSNHLVNLLTELHEAGVLDDDEFVIKRAEVERRSL